MLSAHADRIRRLLPARGLTAATAPTDLARGWGEEATIQPAELVEDAALEWHDVGTADRWPGPVAFLDGTRRSEIVGYCGAAPILVAELSLSSATSIG